LDIAVAEAEQLMVQAAASDLDVADIAGWLRGHGAMPPR
jgi:hypothetical protein